MISEKIYHKYTCIVVKWVYGAVAFFKNKTKQKFNNEIKVILNNTSENEVPRYFYVKTFLYPVVNIIPENDFLIKFQWFCIVLA